MTRFRGAYVVNWRDLSAETRATTGHTCARCHHPFDAETGAALACSLDCDTTRGRISTAFAMMIGLRPYSAHDCTTPGLNFGVHHFDGDRDNNRWWNLLPLCNSCHLTIQAKVIPEVPYLWEHSAWIKPYVAGFYAFWYAHREITREHAERHLDYYLSLGQPWLYVARDDLIDPWRDNLFVEAGDGGLGER